MKKVEISVTKDILDKACRDVSDKCAIALAINALRPAVRGRRVYAHVGPFRYCLNRYSTDVQVCDNYITLPPPVKRYIDKFDRGESVKPRKFTIYMPEWVKVNV